LDSNLVTVLCFNLTYYFCDIGCGIEDKISALSLTPASLYTIVPVLKWQPQSEVIIFLYISVMNYYIFFIFCWPCIM